VVILLRFHFILCELPHVWRETITRSACHRLAARVLGIDLKCSEWRGRCKAVCLAAPRNGIVEIAGPERAPFNEIVARYLKAVGDPREVVSDPEARYFGGRVEECSLVPLGEARLGRIALDEWLRRAQARA
jgi:hypothetical protein